MLLSFLSFSRLCLSQQCTIHAEDFSLIQCSVYPFVPENEFDGAAEAVEKKLNSFEPFTVRVSGFRWLLSLFLQVILSVLLTQYILVLFNTARKVPQFGVILKWTYVKIILIYLFNCSFMFVFQPPNALHLLQSTLESTFPHCDDLSSKKPGNGFQPHLTVGQSGGKVI